LRLRVAHCLPCTPHLAGRRPRGRRAGPRPAGPRPTAGRLGGTRRRLSIRRGGRAGPAAGAERGLRARLRRSAGERRCDERAAGSGLRMGRRARATGAAGGSSRQLGKVGGAPGESLRRGDELDVAAAIGVYNPPPALTAISIVLYPLSSLIVALVISLLRCLARKVAVV